MKKKNIFYLILVILLIGIFAFYDYSPSSSYENNINTYTSSDIPNYEDKKFIVLNENKPDFDMSKDYSKTFEEYSKLDDLGRCGIAFANLGINLMPTEERESIASIKPTGWHTVKYDSINGKYLYNRCHLIGYQLTGENANPQNLITCTRTMNAKTMLQFENKVSEYIKRTNNHVLYRVTPIFENDNLLAKGVILEAKSIEDTEIEFNVFIYNVEDGIEINYQNGDSKKVE